MAINTYLEIGSSFKSHNYWGLLLIAVLLVLTQFKQVWADPPVPQQFELFFTSPKEIEADPGEVVTLSAIARNLAEIPLQITTRTEIPPGWTLIPDLETRSEIPPQKKQVLISALKIPENTLAGVYLITIYSQSLTDQIAIRVNPKTQFVCEIEKQPNLCACDDPFSILLRCTNQGNVNLEVGFEINANPLCEGDLEFPPFSLEPGETACKTISLRCGGFYKSYNQSVFYKIINTATGELLWQRAVTFQVVPKGMPDIDPYVRIPTFFSASVIAQEGRVTFAPEWWGEGYIDPERERRLEFDFCVPTDRRNILYEQYERYYVGLSEPDWEINLGDTVYYLSPLLENCRYGRGAGLDLRPRPLEAGCFYAQELDNGSCNFKEFGSYIGISPADSISSGALNYIWKAYPEYPQSHIVGLEYDCTFNPDNFGHVEAGRDFISTNCHKGKNGYNIFMRGRFKEDGWCAVERSYAGPSFFGSYRDLDLFAANIESGIAPQLRASASVNFLKQKLDLWHLHKAFHEDPRSLSSPNQKQYNVQTTYSFLNGCTFSLTGLIFNARDEASHSQYNFRQKWGGFDVGVNREFDSFLFIGSFGQQKDLLKHHRIDGLQKYYFYYTRSLNNSLQMSLLYDMGNIDYYDAKPWRYGIGGSLRYFYGNGSWASFFAQKVRMFPSNRVMTQISLNGLHVFANKHTLSLSGQYFHYNRGCGNDWQCLVSYTIPFNTPFGKRKDIGSIEGCIYDPITQEALPNALVSLGDYKALSDSRGLFGFQGVPPGQYDFKAEILPSNRVTKGLPNQSVQVYGGEQACVNIPVVYSCKVKGNLIRYDFPEDYEALQNLFGGNPAPLKQKERLAGVRILIVNEETREGYSAMTTTQGAFFFKELRPGKWTLSVIEEDLPPRCHLEQNNLTIELEPNEESIHEFKALPEFRKIKPL